MIETLTVLKFERVYMYMYIYTHICIHTSTYVYVYIYVYICTHHKIIVFLSGRCAHLCTDMPLQQPPLRDWPAALENALITLLCVCM